jgi:hypothetical protein
MGQLAADAAVDGDHLAGDVAGPVRGEEYDELRHVLRVPWVWQQPLAFDHLLVPRGDISLERRAEDPSW